MVKMEETPEASCLNSVDEITLLVDGVGTLVTDPAKTTFKRKPSQMAIGSATYIAADV